MTTFTTITEAIEYIERAIGPDHVEDFDVDGIAAEMVAWGDGRLTLTAEDDDFWYIVSKHDITC